MDDKRKLTPQEKSVFKSRLDWAPLSDLIRVIWWDLTRNKRRWVLMDSLTAGMNWRSAMQQAKSNGPGIMYNTPRREDHSDYHI